MSNASMQIKAVVSGKPSKVMTKSNGREYVLINCEIDTKKGKKIVAGTFTLGENKTMPVEGESTTLIYSVVPSTKEIGKYKPFFEIGNMSASDDEILEALGLPAGVEEQVF